MFEAETDSTISEAGSSTEIPQVINDKFDEIFSKGDPELESVGEATEPVAPKSVASRSKAAAAEQTDELVQEGVQGEDGENAAADAEPKEDEEGQEAAAEAAEPAAPLDPNLRFAAQQFGWKDTEIDKLYEASPELAAKTFDNLLSAFQNLSRQTGVQPPAQQPQVAVAQAAQQQSKFLNLVANLKEFSEVNGEPMGDMLKALHDEVYQPLKQIQAEYAVAKQQAVAAEATTTTTSLAEKFPDFYGKGDSTTLVQNQNRQTLFQIADQLRAGSFQQGQEMSVKNAIEKAHLIVTANQRVADGRKQVVAQVQKRSKAITARPTHKVNPRSAGLAKGNGQAMEAYIRRATELGIDTNEMVD